MKTENMPEKLKACQMCRRLGAVIQRMRRWGKNVSNSAQTAGAETERT